ncbi:MAG: nitronate monooxygenase [Gracilibacteraceae bacterium]|nr:nitronate monooxygenase [Gracilibacteraceae bacterium]
MKTRLTEVIPRLKIPAAAAGGFADGRGLAAALVMGADGVQIGTVFLCSEECEIHINAKNKILASQSTDVVVTGSVRKRTNATRGIRNAFSDKFHMLEDSGASLQELSDLATGTNRKAFVDGDVQNGFVMSGQGITVVKEIRTCKDIIVSINSEAEDILKRAPSLIR